MAKKLSNSINLLEPTVVPLSTWDKIYDWVFKIGRYVIVAVEAVVILAFVSRFIFDRKNNDLKESLDAKANIIESREDFEIKIRIVKSLLNSSSSIDKDQIDTAYRYKDVFKNIPSQVNISDFSMTLQGISLSCSAPNYSVVNQMESEFKNDPAYDTPDVALSKGGSSSSVEFSFAVNFADGDSE
jgi:hypothetical protein